MAHIRDRQIPPRQQTRRHIDARPLPPAAEVDPVDDHALLHLELPVLFSGRCRILSPFAGHPEESSPLPRVRPYPGQAEPSTRPTTYRGTSSYHFRRGTCRAVIHLAAHPDTRVRALHHVTRRAYF